MNEEKKRLQDQYLKGQSLKELKMHQGWKEFEGLIKDIYVQSIKDLIADYNLRSRERIFIIKELIELLDLKIADAEVASEELKKEVFKES